MQEVRGSNLLSSPRSETCWNPVMIGTGQTYAARWAALSEAERGDWLRSSDVRVYLGSPDVPATVYMDPFTMMWPAADGVAAWIAYQGLKAA